ncbi:MAG: recombinase family protein [Opitutaceae bacterium]
MKKKPTIKQNISQDNSPVVNYVRVQNDAAEDQAFCSQSKSFEDYVQKVNFALVEYNSQRISKKVRHSFYMRAKNGLTHGGIPKLGYSIKDGKLFVVEEDAKTITTIFELARKGLTPFEINKNLKAQNLRTRVRRSSSGRIFGGKRYSVDMVMRILRDPIYKGVVVHGGQEFLSQAPALVSEEEWQAAQKYVKGDK